LNENGRFSAQLALVRLMSGREIDNVLFLGNTKIFEEKLHSVFTFTKAYLYAAVGQIRFFKRYRTIFDFCVHLLLSLPGNRLISR